MVYFEAFRAVLLFQCKYLGWTYVGNSSCLDSFRSVESDAGAMLGPIKFREGESVFESWGGAAAASKVHTCSNTANVGSLKKSIAWHVGRSQQLQAKFGGFVKHLNERCGYRY